MAANTPARPRFGWPMRIFLTLIVFDMVFHGVANVLDYQSWLDDYAMPRPLGLPGWPEIAELSQKQDALGERLMATADSVWEFARPWPGKETRAKLESWEDGGRYVVAWLGSRLGFGERLLGLSQEWIMFSPSVADRKEIARARLVFADGSGTIVRLSCDPLDLTNFHRFGNYRVMNYEDDVHSDVESRKGYSNLLAHRYPKNEHGFPLQTIFLYKLTYRFAAPDDDAATVLRARSGPPDWDKQGPFYEYSVAGRKAYALSEEQGLAVQKGFAKTKP